MIFLHGTILQGRLIVWGEKPFDSEKSTKRRGRTV